MTARVWARSSASRAGPFSLSGRRALLAHVRSQSRLRVARHGVEPEPLGPLGREERAGAGQVDVFLIDEVGKMEQHCPAFVEAAPRLLDGAVPVALTVAQKGRGSIAQVKARADVCFVTGAEESRDGLPEELERRVREKLRSGRRSAGQARAEAGSSPK